MTDNEIKKKLLTNINKAIKLYSKKIATENTSNIKNTINDISAENLAINLHLIILKDDNIFLTKNKEHFIQYIVDNIENVKKTIIGWFNYFTMEIKY